MRNTWVSVSSWGLCTGYPATRLSSHSVFQALIFFSMTVFKREIISQSVNTVKNISNCFFFFCAISEMQYVFWQYHRLVIFYISCSTNANLVADWWWTVILITFGKQLNLHPCCKIRATKCVQRTIALYQYKLFNLFPFSVIEFCEVVMFKPWTQYVWSKSGILFFSHDMRNLL